jgi:hypothetical protein
LGVPTLSLMPMVRFHLPPKGPSLNLLSVANILGCLEQLLSLNM